MEVLALAVLAFVLWLAWLRFQRWRRDRLFSRPFPPAWQEILAHDVPLYRRLPADLKTRLHGRIQVFLDGKQFHGFQGQEIDDRVRLVIAANACLLLLGRQNDYYTNFSSIYVYPTTFVVDDEDYDGVVASSGREQRLGESWHRGPLVLAWDSVINGISDPEDGHNVVIHEFAHKLDDMDGHVDGAPLLGRVSSQQRWAEVMRREFEQHQERVQRGLPTVIDPYGASNPAEFFAVLSEHFFEQPGELHRHHPELYERLKEGFGVDPINWAAP